MIIRPVNFFLEYIFNKKHLWLICSEENVVTKMVRLEFGRIGFFPWPFFAEKNIGRVYYLAHRAAAALFVTDLNFYFIQNPTNQPRIGCACVRACVFGKDEYKVESTQLRVCWRKLFTYDANKNTYVSKSNQFCTNVRTYVRTTPNGRSRSADNSTQKTKQTNR